MARRFSWLVCAALGMIAAGVGAAWAAPPSEQFLPATTKGFLSVPDVDLLRAQWDKTQFGQLAKDPVMQPFVEDFERQLKEKLSRSGRQIGLTWDDLDGVYAGEVAIAAIQPGGDEKQHALAMLVDVTGKRPQADELLAKVARNMRAKNAKLIPLQAGSVAIAGYELPPQADDPGPVRSYYAIVADRLVACNHAATITEIVGRLGGAAGDKNLAGFTPFAAAMAKCSEAGGDEAPHLRWFIEPFGYAQVARAQQGGRKRRGTDMLKILAAQGFTAVQGVGGHVQLATERHEALHRTLVYAPAVVRPTDSPNKDKYDLAARMLNFPNAGAPAPPALAPRNLAAYTLVNWKIREAFEYSSTLVDAVVGAAGTFEDVLASIRDDPNGPQIDLRKDFVAHLGERALIITDYRQPITPDSERMLVAVELTNPEAVSRTLNKAMENDPDARKRVFEGQIIWEIINEPADDTPTLVIDGPGVFGGVPTSAELAPEEEDRPLLPNSAMTVAHGYLLVGTHVDYVVDILKQAHEPLNLDDAADYQQVHEELERLGAGPDSIRRFSRSDEMLRPTYELLRQGKMPEAKTLFAQLLNGLLDGGDGDQVREQQIDGSKLPEFEAARRYFGPGGLYVRSLDEGWFVTGCLLAK